MADDSEVLAPMPGFDGYFASRAGKFYSTKRGKLHELSGGTTKDGYRTVKFIATGQTKQKSFRVHIAMMKAWVPNTEEYPQVNHINGHKDDNRLENLEYDNQSMNTTHAYQTGLIKPHTRPVCQADEDGNLISEFESMAAAAEHTGVNRSSIQQTCDGRCQTGGGFVWHYKENFKGQLVRKMGNCKSVQQFTLKNQFIREFESLAAAAEYMDCTTERIGRACRGEQESTLGYVWTYKPKEVAAVTTTEYDDWVSLPEYPNYKISQEGKIYSTMFKKGKILRTKTKPGREFVTLINKDGDAKTVSVHRLVANAYIPNPDNLPNVGHLDHNSLNNVVSNLIWCTQSEDSNRAFKTGHNPNVRAVVQVDVDGKEIARYISIRDAARAVNIARQTISGALSGRLKTAGGYTWKYV